MDVYPAVEHYNPFRSEPMHTMSLGISKILKECLFVANVDSSSFSSETTPSRLQIKTFKRNKRSVHSAVKRFLKQYKDISAEFRVHVNFSKSSTPLLVTGQLFEYGLIRMPAASVYDSDD